MHSKLIVAAALVSVSFAASADRADRRDEHYFWEKTDVTQASAPEQRAQVVRSASADRPLAYGARDARFVILPSVRSRAEVIAGLGEASRLGLLSSGEADLRFATPAQEARIAEAGKARAASGVASVR